MRDLSMHKRRKKENISKRLLSNENVPHFLPRFDLLSRKVENVSAVGERLGGILSNDVKTEMTKIQPNVVDDYDNVGVINLADRVNASMEGQDEAAKYNVIAGAGVPVPDIVSRRLNIAVQILGEEKVFFNINAIGGNRIFNIAESADVGGGVIVNSETNIFDGDENVNSDEPSDEVIVKDTNKTASEIATGGTRNTSIHMNIGKFFDSINVYMADKADTAELERVILQSMNRALAIATSSDR